MISIRHLLFAAALSVSISGLLPKKATAQLPLCPPPAAQEYLLLVRGESEAERAEIAATLPVESSVLICQYIDEILVRAGGFTSLETANAWATYLRTEKGFDSFVSQAAVPPVDNGGNAGETLAYQPRLLGPGYAILVDYGSRPEVAEAVGQLVQPVGVAVYQQRAYLLAGYTSDAESASETLQRLSTARLAAIVVNSEQVVQLAAEVVR